MTEGKAGEFCPRCGNARTGAFRFCRNCGFDYETAGTPDDVIPPGPPAVAAVSNPPSPAQTAVPIAPSDAPASTQAREGRNVLPIVAVIVILGLLLGGLYVVSQKGGVATTSANIPPAGTIWFGSSFDTSTFEVQSRISSATVGQPFALVAHLTKSVKSGEANLRVALNGTTFVNQALTLAGQGEGELVGLTYTPPIAGTYRFDITDLGGTVLATGSIPAA